MSDSRPSCCGTVLSLGVAAFILWLTISTYKPKCFIQYFYLSALNRSLNSQAANDTIFFKLKLENPNLSKGIYYDALNLTFYYPPPNQTTNLQGSTGFSVTIPAFYQGHHEKAYRENSVVATGVNWSQMVLDHQLVVFRVDLKTVIRYKRFVIGKTGRHALSLGGNVQVNDQGAIVNDHGIKLKSGGVEHSCCFVLAVILTVFTSLVLDS